jgi:hypothetical protein
MDLPLVRVVDHGPEDHVCRGVRQGGDDLGDAVHLLEGQVPSPGDVVDDAGCPLDGAFDQGRRGRSLSQEGVRFSVGFLRITVESKGSSQV